jgi:2,5-dihydroxypyridine 5,6-dioxygenase
MTSPAALSSLFERELELCAIQPGETVAVLSQGDDRADYAEAFLAAIGRLGAQAFHVRLPTAVSGLTNDGGAWKVGQTPLAEHRHVIEMLKGVDMVIDLMFLLFSKEQLEIQAAGTRILTCVEPVSVLEHLFPQEHSRELAEAAQERLKAAGTLRFTNPHGTDVTYKLGDYPVECQYGYTDQPGRWDHFPSGAFVYTGGADDGVDGRVVIAPGDILLPFKRFVSDPIELTIAEGLITGIEGGTDASLVRDYMASFDDPRAYALSHIGWGLERRASWTGLATDPGGMWMEARCFAGSVLFSTGPNQELGGTNDTPCHLDIPMRNCDVFLDDEAVVIGGALADDLVAG